VRLLFFISVRRALRIFQIHHISPTLHYIDLQHESAWAHFRLPDQLHPLNQLLLLLLTNCATTISTSHLPTVDLRYVRERATEYNTTSGLFIYRNVRYARPPIGNLRFRKPQQPLREPAGTISDGSQYTTTVCPQPVSQTTPSTNGFSEDCLASKIFFCIV
jgi:hypothetical protein